MSAEADVAFWDDPDEAKSDRVDGAIGEYSQFHQQFGCYGQGVSVATAVLPVGWRDRVVRFDRADAEPSTAMCTAEESVSTEEIAPGRPSMDLGTEFSPAAASPLACDDQGVYPSCELDRQFVCPKLTRKPVNP